MLMKYGGHINWEFLLHFNILLHFKSAHELPRTLASIRNLNIDKHHLLKSVEDKKIKKQAAK